MSERRIRKDPEWFAEQCELMAAVRDSARGIGPDGEPHLLDANAISLAECVWEERPIPVLMAGVGVEGQLIYFPRTLAFHPGSVPNKLNVALEPTLQPPHQGDVYVIDTGWPDAQRSKAAGGDIDVDRLEGHDVVFGHGPAIVDLIEHVGGPGVTAHLRQVDLWHDPFTDDFGTKHHPLVAADGTRVTPIFEAHGHQIRGFTASALVATLRRVDRELGARIADGAEPQTMVVNLSLGAVACPKLVQTDPVARYVQKIADRGVQVVVAAGNHESDVPGWPAAYAAPGAWFDHVNAQYGVNLQPIENVHSVGSDPGGGFSAFGQWVTAWADGDDVSVQHPSYPSSNDTDKPKNATWSGTSFAAPKHAVSLLPQASRRVPDNFNRYQISEASPSDVDIRDHDVKRSPLKKLTEPIAAAVRSRRDK